MLFLIDLPNLDKLLLSPPTSYCFDTAVHCGVVGRKVLLADRPLILVKLK